MGYTKKSTVQQCPQLIDVQTMSNNHLKQVKWTVNIIVKGMQYPDAYL